MLSKNIKISVIIPVFNGEETLAACLNAVARQSLADYEVIVVDNGSTDKTAEIIQSFVRDFPNFSYVLETKRGRGAARHAGVLAARGEVIAMTDSDCLVPEDWLYRLTAFIFSGQEKAVSGFEKDASINYWSRRRQAEDWRFMQTRLEGNYTNHLDTKNFAIRADILKDLQFDPELTACEDWDFFIRLKMSGHQVYFLPDLLVAHFHDSSARAVFWTQFIQGKSATAIINKYQSDPRYQQAFRKDKSTNFFKLRSFLLFLPWAAWQFIYQPKAAPFLVLSDFAWKLGVINFELKRLLRW